eukprot:scaffold12366_cov148-Isochrysis_galbana.AAC.3
MPTHDGRLSLDVHPVFAGGGGARRMCSCTRDGQIDCDFASGSSCRFGRQKPVVVMVGRQTYCCWCRPILLCVMCLKLRW